jgi:hypothetical protein
MTKKEPKEMGAAGMYVELEHGIISIYHCENKILLKRWEANKGDWDKIWKLFDKLEKKGRLNEL